MRAAEKAHVLDYAEHRHLHFLEHLYGPPRVNEGYVLRSGHDYRAGERDGLHERELYVSGAGRQVYDEIVELAPLDADEELLYELHYKRSPPDKGRLFVEHETDRDE